MHRNPFGNPVAALDWATSVEGFGGRLREGDLYPRVRSWGAQAKPKIVLDVGCGQGVGSTLWDAAVEYIGVDPVPLFVERARDHYGNSGRRFVLGHANRVPVEDESCDATFSIAVWHLPRAPAQPAREVHRVLRRGGHFLLITAKP